MWKWGQKTGVFFQAWPHFHPKVDKCYSTLTLHMIQGCVHRAKWGQRPRRTRFKLKCLLPLWRWYFFLWNWASASPQIPNPFHSERRFWSALSGKQRVLKQKGSTFEGCKSAQVGMSEFGHILYIFTFRGEFSFFFLCKHFFFLRVGVKCKIKVD